MSRSKGRRRGKRVYAMGVCLLHGRPVTYMEGRRKGCVSRRHCKWFRGPNEPAPEIVEETMIEPDEKWYECQSCGAIFQEPGSFEEDRGEAFGFPARERVSGCPRCGGGYIEICRTCERE